MTAVRRRLAQDGVDPGAADRAVGGIERALAGDGPLTREQLRDRVAAAGTRTEGQALIHLLFLASLHGIAVRGPMVGKQHAYALTRDWLGAKAHRRREAVLADRGPALAELARRYLAGHGPASDRDLAKWAGLPLRDARAGLGAIAGELRERPEGLVSLKRSRAATRLPPPRLLGSYDPVLHGWTSREPVTGAHDRRLISGGIFRPFALVEGRAVAGWTLRGGKLEIEPLERIPPAAAATLEADAGDVVRFLGPA